MEEIEVSKPNTFKEQLASIIFFISDSNGKLIYYLEADNS